MDYKELDHQYELIGKHLAKAGQCQEYGKFEDADVHVKIADILLKSVKVKRYEIESLENLRESLQV